MLAGRWWWRRVRLVGWLVCVGEGECGVMVQCGATGVAVQLSAEAVLTVIGKHVEGKASALVTSDGHVVPKQTGSKRGVL